MQNNSGRSGEKLKETLADYSVDRIRTMEKTLMDAGYKSNELRTTLTRAVEETNVGLAAHGKGGRGSGTQGNFNSSATGVVEQVTDWAQKNQRKPAKQASTGARHGPEERAQAASAKINKKAQVAGEKHEKFHAKLRSEGGGHCSLCNKFINRTG
jgi:hypothetical protein